MSSSSSASEYLKDALVRLELAGFTCSEQLVDGALTFDAVARRTRFEITKFGFSETFVVFAHLGDAGLEELRAFSSDASSYANRHKTVRLPRGIFESVYCFAVAIASSVAQEVADAVRAQTPARHWSAAEIPVVFDESTGRAHYFENTPVWGAAYYGGFRRLIEKLLLP